MSDKKFFPIYESNKDTVPFESAQEAFFWFIAAQQAKNDGARIAAGKSVCPRPCEPTDIYNVMSRLHRMRRLDMNHFKVLRHYGERGIAPDHNRVKEMRAHKLWNEAMQRIEPILIRKKIVAPRPENFGHMNWAREAMLFQNMGA